MATYDRYVTETASVNFKRSIFTPSRRVLTSYFHGYLHNCGAPIEVLPGDTWKAHVATLIDMSTPTRPLMDNIRAEMDCFFVPKRVIWNKTKLFYGEAETFGIAEKVDEPYMLFGDIGVNREDLDTNLKASENLVQTFGFVYEDDAEESILQLPINVLPIRAFLACYNEHYRDQNYQEPFKWDMDETGEVSALAYRGLTEIDNTSLTPKVNKDKDLFLSILPWAQKGDPVTLPLGDSAPLLVDSAPLTGTATINQNGPLTLRSAEQITGTLVTSTEQDTNTRGLSFQGDSADVGYGEPIYYRGGLAATLSGTADLTNVSVDLRNATAANINQLLYALALQDFLVRSAHFGTKYKDYIYSMFGTTIADATQDVPEYLGRLKINININRVFSTVAQDAGLGEVGAFSVTGTDRDLFTQSFTEPGYIVCCVYTKHQRTYSSGIDKVFLKHELLDYYQDPFKNVGDFPVSSVEWYAGGSLTDIGFQEPWYDYHTMHDRVYGVLNPMMPASLANWTLAERYTEKPTLNGGFIEEDRTALIDALVSGSNGPDYIMDFEFRFEATRVMPLGSTNRLGSL